MARRRSSLTLLTTAEDDFEQIITWYEEQLERAFPPVGLKWEPIKIGHTWQWSDGWDLPKHSLGWRVLAWCGHWLRDRKGNPWQFTPEQTRFILWYFAVDETGTFVYHSAVLQRLKGWGKDPIAACLAMAAMFADVVFDHFDCDRPVGHDQPTAWVQIVAVSMTQTQNTMKIFPSLVSPAARSFYGIQIGKRAVWGLNDTRQIEAVTSSPMAIEGGRPTLIVRNETQNWNSSNGGHDMAGAIEGNAAKAEIDSPARMLDLCNAYRPGEDSVGQRTREAWDSTQGDSPEFADYGLMYDSLEAPPKAPLTVDAVVDVVEAVRGDATWLDAAGRIAKSIADPRNTPSESRRKWYNQVRAAEDAWTDTDELDPLKDTDKVVLPGEEIAMFLDCSKSDDATGLVAVRMSDGHVFTLGMWQRPPGKRGDNWIVPRESVDEAVQAAMSTYRVAGFFGDPSHSLEDETASSYWMPLFDKWHRLYKSKLRIWASGSRKTGTGHAVMFDMSERANTIAFAEAVGVTLQEIKDAAFTFDGDARLRRHILQARRHPVAGYVSIAKENRESKRKIDLAVCMVGARLVRRRILNTKQKRGGRVW